MYCLSAYQQAKSIYLVEEALSKRLSLYILSHFFPHGHCFHHCQNCRLTSSIFDGHRSLFTLRLTIKRLSEVWYPLFVTPVLVELF